MRDNKWYCLIYEKDIAEGLCNDINNERLGYFKTGQLKNIKKIFRLSKEMVNEKCINCPFLPYKDK